MDALEIIDGKKKGRTLAITSFLIIVFLLAGGSFDGTGTFFYGMVSFENENVIIWSIILFFFYSAFRYYLHVRHPFRYFQEISLANLGSSKILSRIIKKKYLPLAIISINSEMLKNSHKVFGSSRISNKNELSDFKWDTYRGVIEESCNYYVYIQYVLKHSGQKVYKQKLPKSLVWLFIFKSIFTDEEFAEVVLPWILALVATILMIRDWII